MAYVVAFVSNQSLGTWYFSEQEQSLDLKIKETTKLSFYAIDPETDEVTCKSRVCATSNGLAIYESLLKTKKYLFSYGILFIPQRTHTARDLLLDFFIPYSRRMSYVIHDPLLLRVIKVVFCVVIDCLTLIIRVFTILPRVIYNYKNSHPLKEKFLAECVFVKCEKTWQLLYKEGEIDQKIGKSCSCLFQWRIDFYHPLRNFFELDRNKLLLDDTFNGRKIVDQDHSRRESFLNQTLFGTEMSNFSREGYYLSTILENHMVKAPTITYI